MVEPSKPVLVLCLGNEVISDDRFGFEVARGLEQGGGLGERVEVVYAPIAGWGLLDLLTGRERVLIVDTIRTGRVAAGSIHRFPAGELTPSRNLTTSHQISLPTVLALGRELVVEMPSAVDVIAVEAEDLETLSEELTPSVKGAVREAIELVREWAVKSGLEVQDGEN